AAYALESKHRLSAADAAEHYGSVAGVVPFDEVEAAGFAGRLSALNDEEWERLASTAPEVQAAAVAPLVNAGDAVCTELAGRSDDQVAVAWQALVALIQRRQLSPIKFAASFAPFASAVALIKPRSLSPSVQRYLAAIGRV